MKQAQALLVGALHAFFEPAGMRHRAEYLQPSVGVFIDRHYVRTEPDKENGL